MNHELQRQKLIDDPSTRAIADAVGLSTEAYVERVMAFVKDPDREPELTLDESAPAPDPVPLNQVMEAFSAEDQEDAFVAHSSPIVAM